MGGESFRCAIDTVVLTRLLTLGYQQKYYFTYCEAGFRTRMLGDHIISAVRTPEPMIGEDPVQY